MLWYIIFLCVTRKRRLKGYIIFQVSKYLVYRYISSLFLIWILHKFIIMHLLIFFKYRKGFKNIKTALLQTEACGFRDYWLHVLKENIFFKSQPPNSPAGSARIQTLPNLARPHVTSLSCFLFLVLGGHVVNVSIKFDI